MALYEIERCECGGRIGRFLHLEREGDCTACTADAPCDVVICTECGGDAALAPGPLPAAPADPT